MDVCTGIMNGFIRSFKYIVKQAEEKFGHPIRITVRLTRDIDQSLRFGFDARTWAKEGLVDMIVPSPRWSNVDTARVDTKRMKEEEPEIYNKFLKVSHSRRFTVKVA